MALLKRSLAIWLLWLSCFVSAFAAQEAAQVILSKGEVKAIGLDGTERSLARRDKVLVGDTLKTGADGMLQVRFVDKALLTLRENSLFRIETYQPQTDAGGNVLMHLVEGGFRTITGSIGKGSKDAYKVTTAAASIGIRGTHYEVVQESATSFVMAVWDGGIQVNNEDGGLNLGKDAGFSYSRVEKGKPPEGLLTPPPVFQQPPTATRQPPREPGKDTRSAEKSGNGERAPATAGEAPPAPLMAGAPPPRPPLNQQRPLAAPAPAPALAPVAGATGGGLTPVNFAETNPTLNQVLEQPTTSNPTEPTPSTSDPWTTVAPADHRLVVAEYQQLQDPARHQALVVLNNPDLSLATIVSPTTPTFLDYLTRGPVSFELHYTIDDGSGSPSSFTVPVVLDKQHTDFNSLVGDIQEDLTAGMSQVGVRQSMVTPGRLEFFTVANDPNLSFFLTNFDFQSSTASQSEVQASLGGIGEGAFSGGEDGDGPMHALVVFGQSGRPSAFLVPDEDLVSDPANPTASMEIGRQGGALLEDYNPTVGGRSNISWGRWAASASNPIHLYEDINQPTVVTDFESGSVYWLTAQAASATALTGTASFQTGASPVFLGSGSDGAVQSLNGSFDVDFTNGTVSNGSLSLATPNMSWNAQFEGVYHNGHAFNEVTHGGITGGAATCSNCVSGKINGIFADPGDRFAGGFNMHRSDQPNVHVNGLFLMEKQ